MSHTSIISLLKKDHKEVNGLLEQAIATTARSADKRAQLFAQIHDALTIHMHFEEEHLYPLLTEKRSTKDDALEAVEEHLQVKRLLRDISETSVEDDRWKAKVMVLAEDVRHHVKEEEKSGGLFDELKEVLDQHELVDLAERFQASKGVGASA